MASRFSVLSRRLFPLLIMSATLCFGWVNEASAAFGNYSVVDGCPPEDWLELEFSVVIEDTTPERRRSLSLEVVKTETGFDGALSSHALGFFREISAKSCTTVLRGLTLALAVYLETRDSVSPSGPSEPAAPKLQPKKPPPQAPVEPEVPPRREFSILVGSEYRNGVAPRAVPTLRIGVSFAELAHGWFGSHRVSAFFNHQPRSRVVLLEGGARDESLSHQWSAGSLHACPWLPELGSTFRVGPCVSLYVGKIWVRGEAAGVSERSWFGFAEVGARLEAHFQNFTVQVHAGTHTPTGEVVFFLGSDQVSYRQQDGFSAGLAVAWAP